LIRSSIKIPAPNKSVSRSIFASVQPDNVKLKGLRVRGRISTYNALFKLEFDGKIETFIFTLDDLLRCIQAAMETLELVSSQ